MWKIKFIQGLNSAIGVIPAVVMPLYLSEVKDFSLADVGLIFMVSGILQAFITPLFATLNDYFSCSKLTFYVSNIIIILTLFLLFPNIQNNWDATIYISICLIAVRMSNSIIDWVANEYAKEQDYPYGKIRIYGSIFYVLLSFSSSFLLGQSLYFSLIMSGVIIAFIQILLSFKIKFYDKKVDVKFISTIKELQHNKNVLLIILSYCLILSGSLGVAYFYAGNYLAIFNLAFLLPIAILLGSAVSEIPSFVFYKKWKNKFGIKKLIIACLILANLRWLLGTLVTGPIMFVLLCGFEGIIFAILWNFTLDIIIDNVPINLKATTLTINASLGMIIAALAQGVAGVFLENNQLVTYHLFLWSITIVGSLILIYLIKDMKKLNLRH